MADFDTTIDVEADAYIPADYIRNEYQKLDIYKRIAAIEDENEYDDMLEELIDRFGDLPKPVMNLLAVARLKAAAHKAYVTEIKQTGREVKITLYEKAKIDPERIPPMLYRHRRRLEFKADGTPRFLYKPEGKMMDALMDFCRELSGAE